MRENLRLLLLSPRTTKEAELFRVTVVSYASLVQNVTCVKDGGIFNKASYSILSYSIHKCI